MNKNRATTGKDEAHELQPAPRHRTSAIERILFDTLQKMNLKN